MKLIKIFLYESYELLTTLTQLAESKNAPNNNNKQTDQDNALLQPNSAKEGKNSKQDTKNRAQEGSLYGRTRKKRIKLAKNKTTSSSIKKPKNIKNANKSRKLSQKMNYHNLFKHLEMNPNKEVKSFRLKRNSEKLGIGEALSNVHQSAINSTIRGISEDGTDEVGNDPWNDVLKSNTEKDTQSIIQLTKPEINATWKLRLMNHTLAFCGHPKPKGLLTQYERKCNLVNILEPIIPELTSTSQILNMEYLFHNYTHERAIVKFKDSIITNRIYGRRNELAKRGITAVRYFQNIAHPLPLLSEYARETERENLLYVQEKHSEEDLIQISEDHSIEGQNDHAPPIEKCKDDSHATKKIIPGPAWPEEEAETHLIASFSRLPICEQMSIVNRLISLVETLKNLGQPPYTNEDSANHQLLTPGSPAVTQTKDRAKPPLEPLITINNRTLNSNLIVPANHPELCLIGEAPLNEGQRNFPATTKIN